MKNQFFDLNFHPSQKIDATPSIDVTLNFPISIYDVRFHHNAASISPTPSDIINGNLIQNEA